MLDKLHTDDINKFQDQLNNDIHLIMDKISELLKENPQPTDRINQLNEVLEKYHNTWFACAELIMDLRIPIGWIEL